MRVGISEGLEGLFPTRPSREIITVAQGKSALPSGKDIAAFASSSSRPPSMPVAPCKSHRRAAMARWPMQSSEQSTLA